MAAPVTVYVKLVDEGTEVWRPVVAERLGHVFRLVGPEHAQLDEQWEFGIGDRVRCELRRLSGDEVLVAVARVDSGVSSALYDQKEPKL
jgi:hypothetical protein